LNCYFFKYSKLYGSYKLYNWQKFWGWLQIFWRCGTLRTECCGCDREVRSWQPANCDQWLSEYCKETNIWQRHNAQRSHFQQVDVCNEAGHDLKITAVTQQLPQQAQKLPMPILLIFRQPLTRTYTGNSNRNSQGLFKTISQCIDLNQFSWFMYCPPLNK
jgi:hypothetical protein